MVHSPKPVGRWLNHLEPRTHALLSEGRRLVQLQARLVAPLGAAAAHCHVGAVRDGELILYADSPAWAARSRYCVPAVLAQLRDNEPPVERVRIKVRPTAVAPVPRPAKRAPLSARAAQTLIDASTGLPDALAAALRRLAGRASGRD